MSHLNIQNHIFQKRAEETVVSHDLCNITKSMLITSDYKDIPTDLHKNIRVDLAENNKTVFGEILTAQHTPVVQELFTYTINDRIWDTTLTGSGSAESVNGLLVLSTGTTAGSSVTVRSKKRVRYMAGMGSITRYTSLFSPIGVDGNLTAYSGFFDDENGLAFGYQQSVFGILRRSKASGFIVDEFIPQANWSEDRCDGTQIMPLLDQTKGNIYQIAHQFLGFGVISCSIVRPDGDFFIVHKFRYANGNTEPIMANPNLPFTYFISNGASSADLTLSSASCGIFIQGKSNVVGYLNTFESDHTVTTTEKCVMAIRNRSLFHGITNALEVYPQRISITSIGGTKPVLIKLISEGSITNPSWTNINTNNSIVEYDDTDDIITIPGTTLFSSFVNKDSEITIDLRKLGIFLSAGRSLLISASTSQGTNEIFASFVWLENL